MKKHAVKRTSILALSTLWILSACTPTSQSIVGKTFADAILIRDTNTMAAIALMAVTDCDDADPRLVNSTVLKTPASGNWKELWTYKACGKLVNVPIKFIKSSIGGTTIAIDVGSISPT